MWTISVLVLLLASYLWGSLSPSYIIVRGLKGIDLRDYGSGTVGGSNAGEQLGMKWLIIAGAADVFKGFLPIALTRAWGLEFIIAVGAGLCAVIGHNWSLYLGFKGGRGIGAILGALCALDARLALLLLMILAIAQFFSQGAPGTLIGLALLPFASIMLNDVPEIVGGCMLLCLISIIKRLEANRLPLPDDPRARRAVLFRRLWWDRDVPHNQPWVKRGRIE